MGYRDSFLTHTGGVMANTEDYLHALDRVIQDKALRVLVCGVENGGEMEVWRSCLPEGSSVTGLDAGTISNDPFVARGDMSRDWIRGVLRERWYDVIVDRAGVAAMVWPFLVAQGLLILPNQNIDQTVQLLQAMPDRCGAWLPSEEIMCVTTFHNVCVIEKRNPMVVPYLNIIMGSDDSVVPERMFEEQGGVRVFIPDTPAEG